MGSHKNKPLTLRQYRAVVMLASGGSVKHVAGAIGVSTETIRTWRRKPAFQERFDAYMQRLFDSALAECQSKLTKALGWLEDLRTDATKDGDKIKAAAILLNAAFKAHEIAILKKELAKMRHLQDLVRQLMEGGGTIAPMKVDTAGDHHFDLSS